MSFDAAVLTMFPEAFPGPLGLSLTGKALQEGLWQLEAIDLRQFGIGKHRNVDDTPAGGGPGMVLRADVLGAAIEAAQALGLSDWQRFRLIVLPQAIRTILPPLGNDFVAMVKDSSLVSVLGVLDVTQLGKVTAAGNFRYFETYNVVALIYLTLTIGLSLLLRRLALLLVDTTTAGVLAVLYIVLMTIYGSHSAQTEIYHVPAMLGMALLVRDTSHPDALKRACMAMAIGGVALQVKYTVVPQCLFFGLWALWGQYRAGRSLPQIAGIAAGFAGLQKAEVTATAELDQEDTNRNC